MSMGLLVPLGLAVMRVVQRNYNQIKYLEDKETELSVVASVNDESITRLERVRTEAIQLLNELSKIPSEESDYQRILLRSKWQLKFDTHYKINQDVYGKIDEYADDVKLELVELAALRESKNNE